MLPSEMHSGSTITHSVQRLQCSLTSDYDNGDSQTRSGPLFFKW